MKRIFGTIISGLALLAFQSCVEESFVQYNPENVTAPVLEALGSDSYTLTEGGSFATFKFSEASFGVNVPVRYTVYMDLAGNDFKNQQSVGSVDSPAKELAVAASSVNPVLIRMDCTPGVETSVEFRVMATWKGESNPVGSNGSYDVYSNAVTAKVVPYYAEREYPKLYLIGSFSGWAFDNNVYLYDFAETDQLYQGLVYFTDDNSSLEFKFTDSGDWDHGDWGAASAGDPAESASIALAAKGSNITTYREKLYYHFSFDKSALTLTKDFSFDSMTLTVDGQETPMTYYTGTQRFYADATLTESSQITFKADDTVYGGALNAVVKDGAAITAGVSGNYRIYFDMNNADAMSVILNADAYGTEEGASGGEEPEPDPVWMVHGQTAATPNWGDNAMTATGNNAFAYVLSGAEVSADAQFGFKDLNVWHSAVASLAGDDGMYEVEIGKAFSISSEGCVNSRIAQAGTYDYWVIPSTLTAYVMPAGQKPEYVADTWGVVGDITDWGTIGDYAMTEEDGYLVRKGVSITSSQGFKIRFGNAWDDTKNYGLETAGTVAPDTVVPVITSSGSKNVNVTEDGTYDIYFDLAASTLYVMTEGKTPADVQ